MNTLSLLEAARKRINMETPLLYDCGARCNAACCQPDEDGKGGMYLFPEEERLYEKTSWCSIEKSDLYFGSQSVKLLTCRGICERNERPLSCRIFPLTPYVRKDQRLVIRLDARAWPVCPLMACGVKGLKESYVASVYDAMKMLWADAALQAYMMALSRHLDQFTTLP